MMELYVVIHNFAAWDDDDADRVGFLIGTFDSLEKATKAKETYLKRFDEVPSYSISINRCFLNNYDEENELMDPNDESEEAQ